MVYSPNGEQIASGSNDNTVRLWDALGGELRYTLQGHQGPVRSVAYSPNGQQIASGSGNTVRLWDIVSGQCLSVIQAFRWGVTSVSWKATPNGQYLVSGSTDKSVRQWEVKKEKDGYKAILCWSSRHDFLTVTDTLIKRAQGLSRANQQLLKQRGAVGESLSLA